jgi:hypothetical protein
MILNVDNLKSGRHGFGASQKNRTMRRQAPPGNGVMILLPDSTALTEHEKKSQARSRGPAHAIARSLRGRSLLLKKQAILGVLYPLRDSRKAILSDSERPKIFRCFNFSSAAQTPRGTTQRRRGAREGNRACMTTDIHERIRYRGYSAVVVNDDPCQR